MSALLFRKKLLSVHVRLSQRSIEYLEFPHSLRHRSTRDKSKSLIGLSRYTALVPFKLRTVHVFEYLRMYARLHQKSTDLTVRRVLSLANILAEADGSD